MHYNYSFPRYITIGFIAISMLTVACVPTFAQNSIRKYVSNNTAVINTIDPKANGYEDLEVIGKAIGDARIVMLGEQDHGDAPTFLAKTRLIKYLHEKKGFNVLAFESDFFALNSGWENVRKENKQITDFLRKNIFGIWTLCGTTRHLFEAYIPDSYAGLNPIKISGFDNQIMFEFSTKHLVPKLDSLLKSLPAVSDIRTRSHFENLHFIDTLMSWPLRSVRTPDYYLRCANNLSELRDHLSKYLEKDNYWLMVIDNLIEFNLECQTEKTSYAISMNARDSQMAQNLQWLKEVKYPQEKIIVWAANYHVAKYEASASIKNPKHKLTTMGSYFTRDSIARNETYVLGFTSHEGTAGRLGMEKYVIQKSLSKSFENWIPERIEYAFIDFKEYQKATHGREKLFYLKAFGHQTRFRKPWTNIFDGMFYIRSMYSCLDEQVY